MGDTRTDLSNDSQIRTAVSEIAKFSELVAETVSSEIKREDFANCDCEIIAMRGQFRRNKYQVQAWAVEYAKQKNLHLFEMTCDTVEKGLDRWLAAISWEREVQSVAEQADELLGPDPNRPTGVLSLERLHENHVFSADDAGNLRANAEALAGLCRVWSPTNVTPSIGGSNKLEAETQAGTTMGPKPSEAKAYGQYRDALTQEAGLNGVGDRESEALKRGRPRDTDPKADKKIAEAWGTGQYKTHGDLAADLKKTKREVKLALDRHRKRGNK